LKDRRAEGRQPAVTSDHRGSSENSADAIGAPLPPDGEERYPDAAAILEAARQVSERVLGPHAQQTDQGPGPNPANFQALAQAGLLGLAIPRQYGGLDASGATQREYTEILASYCGVTTFTQAQHHGPSRMIANGPDETLKRCVLPELAAGRMLCAISFAHLRRPGPPVLRADPVPAGYRLNGTAPWVTGWGLMNQVVFGATLPDGRFVYLWAPRNREEFADIFVEHAPDDADWGTLNASPPLSLCAMNASATVELTCRNLFIPQVHWLSESDRETMQRNDHKGVLGATSMPLGCAVAGIRLLCETAEKRSLTAIRRAASALALEWEEAKTQVLAWNARGDEADFFENAVKIRSWCIELAVRVSHAAVTACSGAANTLTHPAQRLLREAMFYTIQAQTQEVMDATLARLEREPPYRSASQTS
jgi:alkylation response protein AidB-like acyl-CoA dehydrogenase